MKKLIEIKNLSKTYDQLVLENINLNIYENEILILLGRSGIGKTSLMNILTKIDRSYTGEIIYDETIFSHSSIPLPVVFQEFDQLLPWYTVEKNIKIGLAKNKTSQEDDYNKIIAAVGLEESQKKYPSQLSGGMKQRTAIARALMCNSKILFMDEPFGSIDMTLRKKLQDLIKTLNKKFNKTIVFITHDIDEAVYLGHRIAVLGQGLDLLKVDHINDIHSPQHFEMTQKIKTLL